MSYLYIILLLHLVRCNYFKKISKIYNLDTYNFNLINFDVFNLLAVFKINIPTITLFSQNVQFVPEACSNFTNIFY